jgi:hypothetical protein
VRTILRCGVLSASWKLHDSLDTIAGDPVPRQIHVGFKTATPDKRGWSQGVDATLASPPRHLAIGYVDIKQRQPILDRLQCKTTKHESDAKNSQRPLWKIVREVFEEGTDHLK